MPYFDNAATTFPKPARVLDAVFDCMKNYSANPGRSGHKLSLKLDRAIYDTRESLCSFIGGEDVLHTIFTFNGTQSLNMGIHGFVKKGDHVVTSSMEHNSVNRPLMHLKNTGFIDLTIVEADEFGCLTADDIENALTDKTTLVALTHMSNLTGTILPIEEIGKRIKGKARFLVDCAQSIGVLPIDVVRMNIDILAFPGHKGLFAPQGTGGLYINPEIELQTIIQGGTGSFSQDFLQPTIMPDRLESGTENGPGIVGMGEGLKFIQETGIDAIHEKEMRLAKRFVKGVREIEGTKLYGPLDDRQGPVVSMNLDGMDSAEVSYLLDQEYDIYVRPGLHCAPLAHRTIGTLDTGVVRFSFGYFNTEEEVDIALDALAHIAKES